MYITYNDYTSFYGDDRIPQNLFEGLALEADRIMDVYTTGIDGFRKLKEAFPTDESDARMVRFCCARLCDILWQIREASEASRMIATDNGAHSGTISSVSAGNESISYGSADSSLIGKAAASISARSDLIDEIVQGALRSMTDANGVNLMYMGSYPVRG